MIAQCVRKSMKRGIARFASCACFVTASICLLPGGGSAGAAALDVPVPASIPPEIVADWKLQDKVATVGYARAANAIISKLPATLTPKAQAGSSEQDYLEAAHLRRIARLEAYAPQVPKVLYAKHFDLGGAIIGFIEDLRGDGYSSPVQGAKFNFPAMSRGSAYKSGAALMIVELSNGAYGTPATLLSDNAGVIRDPCLSYDGKKVAFAWSKDNNGYHIWEIDIASKAVTQLTDDPSGLTVSDFEPCYLSNGDILFNSSRCYGQVDCNFNITCNLFLMNGQGKYLRQVGFDQVHTTYPTMMSTGKVLYSRWEYNDRNVSDVYGVFTMNPDGCNQIEYWGNQASNPATLPQAREIPGANGKIMCILGGHQGMYCGDLAVIDPNISRNGTNAVQLIAPKRTLGSPVMMDGVDPAKKLFQNPYPLDAEWFLVSYRPDVNSKFSIYLMNLDGERELVASDASMSVSQPIPLVAREAPRVPAYQADYNQTTGIVTMSNAYYGSGTNGTSSTGTVKANTIAKLRVVALEYRINPWFGNVGASAYTSTPVARWMGSWEAKRIVGETKVEADGSAAIIVPARVPLYVQLIDTNGCAINSMRSWMTLQPGEKFSCYGCHEDKNISPPPVPNPIAATPKPLDPFYGISDKYFSFPTYIQPILDKNCISCHKAGHQSGLDLSGEKFWTGDLTDDADNVTACKYWSKAYYNLTTGAGFSSKYVNFITVMSQATGYKANSVGSCKSSLITKLRGGHVKLTKEEMDKLCAWIDLCIPYSGHYTEGMKSTDSAAYIARFNKTRGAHQLVEKANIEAFINDGQYHVSVYNPKRKIPENSTCISADQFNVRLSLAGSKLWANVPCEGTLILVDLSGRRIMAYTFTKETVNTNAVIPLGTVLPKGLYIAKFTGEKIVRQRTVISANLIY
jgi:hypothetical protein